MKELKRHHSYPGYSFTFNGKVYSDIRNTWLSTKVTPNGYVQATLRKYNKTVYVHRMVAELFCPEGTGTQVNHIDGNKQNNHYKNLEWVTASENRIHAFKTGLQLPPEHDQHWNTKVTNVQREEIKQLVKQGNTHRATAAIFGCSRALVGLIVNNKT